MANQPNLFWPGFSRSGRHLSGLAWPPSVIFLVCSTFWFTNTNPGDDPTLIFKAIALRSSGASGPMTMSIEAMQKLK
jgi:hypothetical protein